MARSRRATLASIAGVITIAGCGRPGRTGSGGEQSSDRAVGNRFTDDQLAGSTSPDVSFDELVAEYGADVYILGRDEEFRAVDDTETELTRGTNLGRIINDAQSTVSDGRIVVAAGGSLRVPIEQASAVSITGLDQRIVLTPTAGVDDAYAIHRTAAETSGGVLESFSIDMQYRGGSAIRADGFAGLTFDDLRIQHVGEHGMVFSGGQSVELRDAQFESISKNAVQLTDCSDVEITGCDATVSNQAVSVSGSSDVTVSDVTSREAEYNAFRVDDYTENWDVTGCTAIDSGRTAFSASAVRNGSFVDCVAEGTTADSEAGFEIEYRADSDSENQQTPVTGCSVESCTARNCDVGFYAREDDSRYDTDTPIVGPRFIDCTAENCATGLFIGDTVEDAVVENFEASNCDTDVVDNGVRTVIDGRSENVGDPSSEGEWFGHAETALALDIVVEDTRAGRRYAPTEFGEWGLV